MKKKTVSVEQQIAKIKHAIKKFGDPTGKLAEKLRELQKQ